ncbi:MAG: AsmA family protein, partial [Pseudomonadota bacterium]
MIKKIFWTLIILMMLGVGTIAGGLIFITNSDLNQWKKTIEEFAYQQTGRKLSIDGQLDLTLSMQPHLMVEKLRLQSPDWSEHENDIEIEHLKIQLGFSNIFSGIIDILNIEAKNIYVLVETKQSSHNDFGFIESASQNTTNENPQSDQHQSLNFFDWKKLSNHMFGFFPLVHHAILSDITVEILNHQNSIHENFLLNRVHLVKHDNNHSLMDTLIDLSFKGQDVKLVGFISSPSSILKNQPWSVELEGSLANSRTYVKGFINDLKNLSGVDFKFLLNTENIEHLIKLFNQTLPLQGFMSLEASINDDNALQELFVEQLKFILGDEHAPLKANLESQINLAQQPSIELSGLIELSDIRELNQWNNWLGFKLPLMPDLGKSRLEIAMQATELDSKIPTVNIDAFKFEIDHLKHIIHLEIDGQISDVLSPQMRSLDAELELFAAEASTIATELKPWMIFSGFDLSNLSIPSLGALEFKTSINGSGDTLSGYGLDHFDLTIGDERHLWVAAKGSVGALGADGFMQGDLNFYSADLNLLQPLTGISFTKPTQASTQFDINGRIGKDMNLNPLNLQIANTDLSGRVSIDT